MLAETERNEAESCPAQGLIKQLDEVDKSF